MTSIDFLVNDEPVIVDGKVVDVSYGMAASIALENAILVIHDAEGRSEVAEMNSRGRIELPTPPDDGVIVELSGGVLYRRIPGEFPLFDTVRNLVAEKPDIDKAGLPLEEILAFANRALSYAP